MGFFKNFVKALSDPVNLAVAAVSTAVLGPVGGYTALQSFAIRAAASAALAADWITACFFRKFCPR